MNLRLELFVAVILLVVVALCGCATDPYSVCKRDALTRASSFNAAPGFLGNLLVSAIDRPPPHPPLKDMLAACETLK